MGFAYKFGNPDGVYFVTSAVVEWVDAFTRYQNNPVEARLVDSAERYVYSSAKDYYSEKGILPIVILENTIYNLRSAV